MKIDSAVSKFPLNVVESSLVGEGIVIRIGRFPVQTPLGARPGLGTQLRYEDPGDLWIKIVKTQ